MHPLTALLDGRELMERNEIIDVRLDRIRNDAAVRDQAPIVAPQADQLHAYTMSGTSLDGFVRRCRSLHFLVPHLKNQLYASNNRQGQYMALIAALLLPYPVSHTERSVLRATPTNLRFAIRGTDAHRAEWCIAYISLMYQFEAYALPLGSANQISTILTELKSDEHHQGGKPRYVTLLELFRGWAEDPLSEEFYEVDRLYQRVRSAMDRAAVANSTMPGRAGVYMPKYAGPDYQTLRREMDFFKYRRELQVHTPFLRLAAYSEYHHEVFVVCTEEERLQIYDCWHHFASTQKRAW